MPFPSRDVTAWIDEAYQAIQKVEGSISVRRAYGSADNLRGLADVTAAADADRRAGTASVCM